MIPILLLVVALAGLGLLGWCLLALRGTDAELASMSRRATEGLEQARVQRAMAAELAAQLDAELAEAVLDAGTSGVRDVHRTIADIPFTILESLPATRAATEAVREVHDRTSDGVYDAIAMVNKATNGLFRAIRRRD